MLLAKQMGGGFWPPYESDDHGVAGVIGGFFTVVEVAKIITLWPWL